MAPKTAMLCTDSDSTEDLMRRAVFLTVSRLLAEASSTLPL
jgi:hypothetical protein